MYTVELFCYLILRMMPGSGEAARFGDALLRFIRLLMLRQSASRSSSLLPCEPNMTLYCDSVTERLETVSMFFAAR